MLLEIGSGEVAAKVFFPAVQLLCTWEDNVASSSKNRLKRQLARFKFCIKKVSLAVRTVAQKNKKTIPELPGWARVVLGPANCPFF